MKLTTTQTKIMEALKALETSIFSTVTYTGTKQLKAAKELEKMGLVKVQTESVRDCGATGTARVKFHFFVYVTAVK